MRSIEALCTIGTKKLGNMEQVYRGQPEITCSTRSGGHTFIHVYIRANIYTLLALQMVHNNYRNYNLQISVFKHRNIETFIAFFGLKKCRQRKDQKINDLIVLQVVSHNR